MTRHTLHWLPNFLTILRCFMGAFVAYAVWLIAQKEFALSGLENVPLDVQKGHAIFVTDFRQFWGGLALFVFIVAAVTDWLDGFLARKWSAISRLGRLLDPIADKVVIGLPLLTIAHATGWVFPVALPVLLIVGRDVLITVLRFIGLGADAMAVSWTAKIKTFIEMIVLIVFLASLTFLGTDSSLKGPILLSWVILLWFAAALSVWTGLRYLLQLRIKKTDTQPSNTEQTAP